MTARTKSKPYKWLVPNGSLVLAQTPVSDKSNEITAIPVLLEQLHVQGTIQRIDAMGTHRRITQQINAAGADYILALKGNQGFLHKKAVAWFEDWERQMRLP